MDEAREKWGEDYGQGQIMGDLASQWWDYDWTLNEERSDMISYWEENKVSCFFEVSKNFLHIFEGNIIIEKV